MRGWNAWPLLLLSGVATVCAGACGSVSVYEGEEDPNNELDSGGQQEEARPDAPPDRYRPDVNKDAPEASSSDADAGDASAKDADADVKKDGDFAETGSLCSPLYKVESRKCGYCGQQFRTCMEPDGGLDADIDADGGVGVWLDWGGCFGEVDGGCYPGDEKTEACGKCGTTTVKCTTSCQWPAAGACTGQGPCWPGDLDYAPAISCPADEGRERECTSSCTWGAWGACQEPPGDEIFVPTTVGGRVAKRIMLTRKDAGYVQTSSGKDCPAAYTITTHYPYTVVKVTNPTSNDAVISVWTYPSTGTDASLTSVQIMVLAYDFDPEDAGWDAAAPGAADAAPWRFCIGSYGYCCYDKETDPSAMCYDAGSSCLSPYWGGLMDKDDREVTVPAGSSIWLRVQNSWSTLGEGHVMLGIKTHSI